MRIPQCDVRLPMLLALGVDVGTLSGVPPQGVRCISHAHILLLRNSRATEEHFRRHDGKGGATPVAVNLTIDDARCNQSQGCDQKLLQMAIGWTWAGRGWAGELSQTGWRHTMDTSTRLCPNEIELLATTNHVPATRTK